MIFLKDIFSLLLYFLLNLYKDKFSFVILSSCSLKICLLIFFGNDLVKIKFEFLVFLLSLLVYLSKPIG
jgi:hypothetical protein